MDTIFNLLAFAISYTERFTVFEISGLLGVALYVGNYGAVQLGQMDGNSMRYTILNGTAATLVLISLMQDWNLASALIQIMWIAFSFIGICRAIVKRKGHGEYTTSTADALAEYRRYQRQPQTIRVEPPHARTDTTSGPLD